MVDKLGAAKKELDQNTKAIDKLRNNIASLKNADRAGGQAVQDAVDTGLDNLEKQAEKLQQDLQRHDDRKPNSQSPKAVKDYNDEADRLDARRKALVAEADALTKAKDDPRAAREWLKKKISNYELAKEKLGVDRVNLEQKFRYQRNEFAPAFQGMIDRCQWLAKRGAGNEDLKTGCGFLFDRNNPYYQSLVGLGVDPGKLIGTRAGSLHGDIIPFPSGPGQPKLGPQSPFEPGWEPGGPIPSPGPGHRVYPPGEEEDDE